MRKLVFTVIIFSIFIGCGVPHGHRNPMQICDNTLPEGIILKRFWSHEHGLLLTIRKDGGGTMKHVTDAALYDFFVEGDTIIHCEENTKADSLKIVE